MTLPSLLLFASTFAIACAAPGPTTTALTARVLARGTVGAPALCLGLLLGDLFWLLCATFGVAALARDHHELFVLIRYVGVVYLLYLAWKFWTAPAVPGPAARADAGAGARAVLGGLALALGNPKTALFYIALLPCVMSLGPLRGLDLLVLAAIVCLIYGAVLAAYVLLATRLRRFVQSTRALRAVNRTGAALMAGAAGVIATR
ncbi:MAG TPA: LysE family translocator [Lysobacter sp.]